MNARMNAVKRKRDVFARYGRESAMLIISRDFIMLVRPSAATVSSRPRGKTISVI